MAVVELSTSVALTTAKRCCENENEILYEYLFGWGNEVGNMDDCAVSFQINSKSVFLSTAPSHAKTDWHQKHQK